MIERGGPDIFKNLPVFPDSTPAMIHRPSRRLLVEAYIERLAAPIWRMLRVYGF